MARVVAEVQKARAAHANDQAMAKCASLEAQVAALEEQLETAQPFDDDLPGCGQFYCVETARYFVDQKALDDHKKSRAYKRRVKELKEETPFTQKDAEAAAGMTKERLPSAAESRAKAEAKKGHRMTDD